MGVDPMSLRSQVSRVAVCRSKVKVPSVTKLPNELLWTAKNQLLTKVNIIDHPGKASQSSGARTHDLRMLQGFDRRPQLQELPPDIFFPRLPPATNSNPRFTTGPVIFPTWEFMSKHLPPRIVSNALVPPWWPNCRGMGSIQIDHHCTKEAQSSIRFKILFSSHSFIGFRHHLPRNSNNRRAFSIQLVQR